MKKIIIGMMSLLLVVGLVSASPNFWLEKNVAVTGDWVWDGNSWTKPTPKPITATYYNSVVSPNALFLGYDENEVIGNAWEYRLNSNLYLDDSSRATTNLWVTTINPPTTTQGIAWTDYRLENENYGEFSMTSLKVSGTGYGSITSNVFSFGELYQNNLVRIN